MTNISKPQNFVAQYFPNQPTERQIKENPNIWWRVALSWIPPRHQMFDYLLEMGRPYIEDVMAHRPISLLDGTGKQNLMFIFPERWLTTQEEQQFPYRLERHPQIISAELTTIDIVTKSALMIGNYLKDDIRIIKPENGLSVQPIEGTK